MIFSEAMFYKKLFDIGFPYKHFYFKTCWPTRQNGVENRDKAYYFNISSHKNVFSLFKDTLKIDDTAPLIKKELNEASFHTEFTAEPF